MNNKYAMIGKNEFIQRIIKLPTIIQSKTKTASYTDFILVGNELNFIRVNTRKKWKVNVLELYQIYCSNTFINTSVIKKITGGKVNSPSVAILMSIKCIDDKGNRIINKNHECKT